MIARRGEELPGEAPDSHKVHIGKMACKEARLQRSCSPSFGVAARTGEIGETARIETCQVSETWQVCTPTRPRNRTFPTPTSYFQASPRRIRDAA